MTDIPRHSPQEPDPILPSEWPELAPLIDVVLDAAPEQRAALMVTLAAGDAGRLRALEQLVAECERDTPLLNRGAAERFDALAREPQESLLPEMLAGRYQTGRELGRGGMARVYLARDTKHGRDVAIKVIRPELSASLGHGRFLREIEIAARLRHPNIVPLYDSGDVAGSLYFVMPFEDGRSLRERLRDEGRLPIADAMSVLRDVARALAYAHEHGVVHRDVKPDNVMLSGDAAVVTDFGIAKAVSVALTDGVGPTLTQAGSGIGTPAYMAPEQAMGDPGTDHRADIYSFGCLAYELFAGTPPFAEPTSHQMVAAHVSRVPRPVTDVRAEVPREVADLIARCLSKLPDDRPQQVREILSALDGATTAGSGARVIMPPTRFVRSRPLAWGSAVLMVAAIGLTGYVTNRSRGTGSPITLSVLPLGNTTGDTAAEFLSDGLPDEIASRLGRVSGIQIRSRSGARVYRGQLGVDVTEAGAKLGADYIVTGMVRSESGRWLVSLDLSRAADKTSIWGENFSIGPDQQVGAVDTITANLLASLRSRFPKSVGEAPLVAPRSQTRSGLANNFYLGGQAKLSRRGQSVMEAADLFRQSVQQDTLFAPAWSGLSMALALSPFFHEVAAKDVSDSVVVAAHRALRLNPKLAQPHIALGISHWFAYRWDSAEVEFKNAIMLDPQDVEARIQYARHLGYVGRRPESMEHLQVARALDPASSVLLSHLAYSYYLNGEMDSATAVIRLALEYDPGNYTSLANGVLIHLRANRQVEARRLLDRMVLPHGIKGYLLARTGDTAGARRHIEQSQARIPQSAQAHTVRAFTYLGLGDTASALDELEGATTAQEIWQVLRAVRDPVFDPVRGSPRFNEIVKRLGLQNATAADRR